MIFFFSKFRLLQFVADQIWFVADGEVDQIHRYYNTDLIRFSSFAYNFASSELILKFLETNLASEKHVWEYNIINDFQNKRLPNGWELTKLSTDRTGTVQRMSEAEGRYMSISTINSDFSVFRLFKLLGWFSKCDFWIPGKISHRHRCSEKS